MQAFISLKRPHILLRRQNVIIAIVLALLVLIQFSHGQDNRIPLKNGQMIFASGMNMAWGDFAKDAVNLNVKTFKRALNDISSNGGNSMRWWVHVNGSASPTFTNGMVSGLSTEIENIKQVLDFAYERKVVICLVLWSFDMLQDQDQDQAAMRNIVTDTTYTHAYIDNALIPLVTALKGHSGLLCWEICNEPEGMTTQFGWTPTRVDMSDVQRFVNLLAGAIHRTAPNELVTNGSWSFRANSDIGDYFNYYTDERLITAGGDSLGVLDFYQVHYYDWGKTDLSPFHHPASYWKLDKPILIGEFQADGPLDKTPLEAYKYMYDNGYCGAWSWTWTGHDGNGDVNDAKPGMQYLREHYPEDIVITFFDGID